MYQRRIFSILCSFFNAAFYRYSVVYILIQQWFPFWFMKFILMKIPKASTKKRLPLKLEFQFYTYDTYMYTCTVIKKNRNFFEWQRQVSVTKLMNRFDEVCVSILCSSFFRYFVIFSLFSLWMYVYVYLAASIFILWGLWQQICFNLFKLLLSSLYLSLIFLYLFLFIHLLLDTIMSNYIKRNSH